MNLLFPSLTSLPLDRYAAILEPGRMREISARIRELRDRTAGRVIWNVSSSATGGGVAEMVRSLLAYARGAGADARWAVIRGSRGFFRVTKRLHNALHGHPGDGSPLGEGAREVYEANSRDFVRQLAPMIRSCDVVIVHDPQPAGMIPELARLGARVIWRSHVGSDVANQETAAAWSFLLPYVQQAEAFVFTRASYAPAGLDPGRVAVIPPTIDPFSAKNQLLSAETVRAILLRMGVFGGGAAAAPVFSREDGTPGRVDRMARVIRDAAPVPLGARVSAQVSRWDRLKDPLGVMLGFARTADQDSYLLLVGPDPGSVADDPEGAGVYREVTEAWRALPGKVRSRVHLVRLPVADVEENAAMVNAIQRYSNVVVQKSLYEGFGLTVTEALWKARPVIASAVGGIRDQIEDGVDGLLLQDPRDLETFAALLERLLGDEALGARLGRTGHARTFERYLGIGSLLRYGELIERLDERTGGAAA